MTEPTPALDFSMFSRADLVNLCHQRSYPETTQMQAQLADVSDGPDLDRLRAEIVGFVMDQVAQNLTVSAYAPAGTPEAVAVFMGTPTSSTST